MPNIFLLPVRRQAFLFFFIAISVSLQAQKITTVIPQADWHVQTSYAATGNNYSPPSYKKSILYLETGEIAIAINYNKDEWGAAKINAQGKKLWETMVKGPVRGISKIGNNILLFYGDEDERKSGSKISAALIDGKTGKQIKNRVLFDYGSEVYLNAKAMNRPDGSFAFLMVRVSKYIKRRGEILESEKVMLIRVNEELEPNSTNIEPIGRMGFFTGAELLKDDVFCFTSIKDDQLTVERFSIEGNVIDKLSTPIELRTQKYRIDPVITIDPLNSNTLFIGITYTNKNKDHIDQAWEFDFNTKKVRGSGALEYNKDYRKGMEVKEVKGLQNGRFDENIQLIDIIATPSKIAVIKEIQYTWLTGSQGTTVRYRHDAMMIEIYDRNWKLNKTLAIDKKFESFYSVGGSVGLKAIGEKLYAVMTAIDAPLKYATIFAVIDLSKQEVETLTTLDRKGISNINLMEGSASIWTADGVFIEYLVEKGGLFKSIKDYTSIWQKVAF
jgi:hypothetical protein